MIDTTPSETADIMTRQERSALMGRVGAKDTKPELIVRRLLHREGYRYRLHARHLAGRPDIIFPGRRAVIFVHGCFWHRHLGCRRASNPKARASFWQAKFAANIARDAAVLECLTKAGWRTLVIWECETRQIDSLKARLFAFLGPSGGTRPR